MNKSILDKVEELWDSAKIEDFYCIAPSGDKYWYYDIIVEFLLDKEVLCVAAQNIPIELFVNYKDGVPFYPERKELPKLLEVYLSDGDSGIYNYIKRTLGDFNE